MSLAATTDIKEEVATYLKSLRDSLIQAFETLEPKARFKRTCWDYKNGSGGGEMSVIRGDVFEKAAVNWSAVFGDSFPMKDGSGPFFATGVSLITHMHNPHNPTVHMNVRYIKTEEHSWFGGGYDLTPMGIHYQKDIEYFHSVAQKALDRFGTELYPSFMQQAKEYFFIPHRNKERGVGGIFFDNYNTGHFEKDLEMWKSVGSTFIDAIMPIYQKRCHTPYTQEEKEEQLKLRAHYVEFNLLYDRGTKFGFQSGGNPEAILCSMPPVVKW